MILENISEQTLIEDIEQLLSGNILQLIDIVVGDNSILYQIGVEDENAFQMNIRIQVSNDFESEEALREFCKEELRRYINAELELGEDVLPMKVSREESSLLRDFSIEQIAEIYDIIERNVYLYNQIENI